MAQWYLSYNGKQFGPYDDAQAMEQARLNPDGFAWREGYTGWVPLNQVAEFSRRPEPSVAPPPVNVRTSDEIDFKIFGTEMQFVEVELDPGESVVAEAGAMMYKDPSIQMQTVFGDGSSAGQGSFMDKLVGAGKRLLTGESLFMTMFSNAGSGKSKIAFGAPYPGNIIPIALSNVGRCLICQKDAFLCAARGVSVGIHFQRKILTGLFGGEGFIMERLDGEGMIFMHAGGTIVERQLQSGQVLHVDTGCIVAYEPTVDFDILQAGGIKSMLFGGEGFFFATLRGPGKIWLQSLPFSRLAGRMLAAAPQRGGSSDEGSVLGPIGTLLGGH